MHSQSTDYKGAESDEGKLTMFDLLPSTIYIFKLGTACTVTPVVQRVL